MTRRVDRPYSGFGFAWLLLVVALAATTGCADSAAKSSAGKSSEEKATATVASDKPGAKQTTTAASEDDKADAAKLLADLVARYQGAKSYEDAGELRLAVVSQRGEKQGSPAIPFSAAFERPNKIRVHSLEASLVADGKEVQASADSLEGQVLVLPCPEKLTEGSLVSDALLVQAMHGQIDVAMPQLSLLLDEDPIKKIAGDGQAERLADEEFDGEKCRRVSIAGPNGASVFWISPKTGLLVKFEFPANSFKQKFSLSEANVWAEFKGARVDDPIAADAFKFAVPEGAKRLKKFLPPPPEPPSPLLGKIPEDFTFVDFRGGTVDRKSLEGKVVVLDMWATWCGWCFEGFPNLQKVYDEFAKNDKVVILAVNKDDLAVSDEKVKESFQKAKLTIPIARDQQQMTDKVFSIPGLPTMVVLGADGKVEDFHVGYDAKLAETLPAKLNRLLAGESLAKEELDKYEAALKAYQQQENDARVADAGQTTAQ